MTEEFITNNQTEYEALIASLKLEINMGTKKLEIFSDSQLVVQQMTGEYEVKDAMILQYAQKAK